MLGIIKESFLLKRKTALGLADYLLLKRTQRYRPGSVKIFGCPVEYVDPPTFIEGLREIFIQENYDFPAENDSPLIIDCGANIGLSVIYFKRRYPHCRIVAYEADPAIFRTLSRNAQLFGLSDVVLENRAVWHDERHVEFRQEGGLSGRIALAGDARNLLTVPTVRLRRLLEQQVDFLKVDIEGAEVEVLKDCADLLGNVASLFVEYHSPAERKQELHTLLGILGEAGYRYYIREAFVGSHPLTKLEQLDGMDMQLNIYAVRPAGRLSLERR